MAARREELTRQFPDQWVALYHDGEGFQTFVAKSQEELIQERDRRGLEKDFVTFTLLETERRTFIL